MATDSLKNVMGVTMEKIREMISTDCIIGKPVTVSGNITIIPITKVSFGFASGGSDLPTKNTKDFFAGGGGAGVSMNPVAFIVVTEDDIKLLQMSIDANPTNQALNIIPDLLDKVVNLVKKDKKPKDETAEVKDETENKK